MKYDFKGTTLANHALDRQQPAGRWGGEEGREIAGREGGMKGGRDEEKEGREGCIICDPLSQKAVLSRWGRYGLQAMKCRTSITCI